jgi:hypothetical protein
VTKQGPGPRCGWCGRRIEVAAATGRPRRYCRPSCRQRAYEARRRAAEVGLSEAELVVARSQLDELHDRLYVLTCAVEDVERDLRDSATRAEYREAIDWLLEAARPLTDLRLG